MVRRETRKKKNTIQHTLGQTRTQDTGNLLEKSLGSDEGIVLASELLDELLVLVQLLQVVSRHGVDTAVLGTVQIVLVTQDADGHVGARDGGQLDGAGETLVTLGVIVLQADLELDGLEEVALLGLVGVLQELGDLRPDIGCAGGVSKISIESCDGLSDSIVVGRGRSDGSGNGNGNGNSNGSGKGDIGLTDCNLRHLGSLPIDFTLSNGDRDVAC